MRIAAANPLGRRTILVLLLTAIQPLTAFAVSTPQPDPSPIFIVQALTQIENEGKPTLDLQDLERYFVNRLAHLGVEHVVPSTTTKIANPPLPNIYLIEVSVDAMRTAERSEWNDNQSRRTEQDIFEVDLSLAVKHVQSGRVFGTTGERYEHRFNGTYPSDHAERCAAIFAAADNLADRFVTAAAAGQFGPQLVLQRILVIPDWLQPAWLSATFAVFILLVLAAMIAATIADTRNADAWREQDAQRQAAETLRIAQQKQEARFDERLQKVFAKTHETNSFCDQSVKDTARRFSSDILSEARNICGRKGQRDANRAEVNAERAQIARYAARRGHLEAEILELLRHDDEYEFRLLTEARNMQGGTR